MKDGTCFIVQRDVVLPLLAEAFGVSRPLTDNEVRALCLLNGNDYIPNAFGPETLKSGKFLEYLADPLRVLHDVDRDPRKSPSSGPLFSVRFMMMLHFWNHPPCFVVSGAGGEGVITDAEWNANQYTVDLGFMRPPLVRALPPAQPLLFLPLLPAPPLPPPSYADLCGFDPVKELERGWESAIPLTTELHRDLFTLRLWSRTGLRLRGLPFPRVGDVAVRHGAVIDWSIIAPENVPHNILKRWYESHGHHSGQVTPADLLKKIAAFRAAPETLGPVLQDIPLDITEHIIAPPEGAPYTWLEKDAMLAKARITIPPLSDEYVDLIFGPRMNGIRYRAQGLVAGGHIDVVSCRITEGRLRGTTKKCFIFNCVCSASVVAKGYNVCIVFDDTKKYCEEGSSCKCADGNLFCSHMLAALCLLYIFQLDDSTFDDLLHILPEGVMTIQNIACPWDFLLKLDNFKYKHE